MEKKRRKQEERLKRFEARKVGSQPTRGDSSSDSSFSISASGEQIPETEVDVDVVGDNEVAFRNPRSLSGCERSRRECCGAAKAIDDISLEAADRGRHCEGTRPVVTTSIGSKTTSGYRRLSPLTRDESPMSVEEPRPEEKELDLVEGTNPVRRSSTTGSSFSIWRILDIPSSRAVPDEGLSGPSRVQPIRTSATFSLGLLSSVSQPIGFQVERI